MRLLLILLIAGMTVFAGYRLRPYLSGKRTIYRRIFSLAPWILLLAVLTSVATMLSTGSYQGWQPVAGLGAETTLFCAGILWESHRRRKRLALSAMKSAAASAPQASQTPAVRLNSPQS